MESVSIPFEDLGTFRVCAETLDNMRLAAETRVLMAVPEPTEEGLKYLKRAMYVAARRLCKRNVIKPLSTEELLTDLQAVKVKRKRNRYLKAFYSLQAEAVNYADARVTAFTKSEVVAPKPGKFFKPRMIQYRGSSKPDGARFLVEYWRYLKPIEHAFISTPGLFCPGRACAKSMDQFQRAEALRKAADDLVSPCSVAIDGSAFDAHVGVKILKLKKFFLNCVARFSGWDAASVDALSALNDWQLVNWVRGIIFTEGSIKYRCAGNIMSGDLDTSLTGALVMSSCVTAAMRMLDIDRNMWRMVDDGDDCALLVESAVVSRFGGPEQFRSVLVDVFKTFGQEITCEDIVHLGDDKRLELIDFCSARPVFDGARYKMVRYHQSIGKIVTNPRWFRNQELAMKYLAAVGHAEGVINSGIPCWSAIAAWARQHGTAEADVLREVSYEYRRAGYRQVKVESSEVCPAARESYHLAFGVSPLEQIRIEQQWLTRGPVRCAA